MDRRSFISRVGAGAILGATVAGISWYAIPLNEKRRVISKVSYEYANDYVPKSQAVCGPPEDEYVGLVSDDPDSFRTTLQNNNFESFPHSFLHAFKRDGEMYYERGNLIRYYENGDWQLHVRIFDAPNNQTYVFGHYEPSQQNNTEKHESGDHINTEKGHELLNSLFDIKDKSFEGTLDIDSRCS